MYDAHLSCYASISNSISKSGSFWQMYDVKCSKGERRNFDLALQISIETRSLALFTNMTGIPVIRAQFKMFITRTNTTMAPVKIGASVVFALRNASKIRLPKMYVYPSHVIVKRARDCTNTARDQRNISRYYLEIQCSGLDLKSKTWT